MPLRFANTSSDHPDFLTQRCKPGSESLIDGVGFIHGRQIRDAFGFSHMWDDLLNMVYCQ